MAASLCLKASCHDLRHDTLPKTQFRGTDHSSRGSILQLLTPLSIPRQFSSIRELEGEKRIVSPPVRRSRQVFEGYLAQYGVDDSMAQEVASIETIWFLARENKGIGILSDNGHPVHEGPARLIFEEAIDIPLHIVCLPRDRRSRLAQAAFASGQILLVDEIIFIHLRCLASSEK